MPLERRLRVERVESGKRTKETVAMTLRQWAFQFLTTHGLDSEEAEAVIEVTVKGFGTPLEPFWELEERTIDRLLRRLIEAQFRDQALLWMSQHRPYAWYRIRKL